MKVRTFLAVTAVLCSLEFLATLYLETSVLRPGVQGMGWIVMVGAWMLTLLTVSLIAALRGPCGARSASQEDSLPRWMQTNVYFAQRDMQRNVGRLTQLTEDQALRERARNGW